MRQPHKLRDRWEVICLPLAKSLLFGFCFPGGWFCNRTEPQPKGAVKPLILPEPESLICTAAYSVRGSAPLRIRSDCVCPTLTWMGRERQSVYSSHSVAASRGAFLLTTENWPGVDRTNVIHQSKPDSALRIAPSRPQSGFQNRIRRGSASLDHSAKMWLILPFAISRHRVSESPKREKVPGDTEACFSPVPPSRKRVRLQLPHT